MLYITIPVIEVCDQSFAFEYKITNSENIVKRPDHLVELHDQSNAWIHVQLSTAEVYTICNNHAKFRQEFPVFDKVIDRTS